MDELLAKAFRLNISLVGANNLPQKVNIHLHYAGLIQDERDF
jgi:hypothetical protein